MKSVQKKRFWWLGAFIVSIISLVAWALSPARPQQRSTETSQTNDNQIMQVQFQGARGSAFDLRNLTIPAAEIRSGGPPKDGIPALSNPTMLKRVHPLQRRIGSRGMHFNRIRTFTRRLATIERNLAKCEATHALEVVFAPI